MVFALVISAMEVNRGHNGIQQLLTVEQEAQQIVNASKNGNCDFTFLSSSMSFFCVCVLRKEQLQSHMFSEPL